MKQKKLGGICPCNFIATFATYSHGLFAWHSSDTTKRHLICFHSLFAWQRTATLTRYLCQTCHEISTWWFFGLQPQYSRSLDQYTELKQLLEQSAPRRNPFHLLSAISNNIKSTNTSERFSMNYDNLTTRVIAIANQHKGIYHKQPMRTQSKNIKKPSQAVAESPLV